LPTYKRSIAKKIEKESEAARLYFKEQMKPAKIAKQLRLDIQQVYALVARMKRKANDLMSQVDPRDVPLEVKFSDSSN
jgi:hypothetical protein